MSDDEADPELVELLRQHFIGKKPDPAVPETRVLESAKYIMDNSIDVAINMRNTKEAAAMIYEQMQKKSYSTSTWSSHELHPKEKTEDTVNFIFTMDLLNFCFWSEKSEEERFQVEYKGRKWTGYWSLVAILQRALEEEIPITTPDFWRNRDEFTEEKIRHIFRSATDEVDPMLLGRLAVLREAGDVLYEHYDSSIINLVEDADKSAARLVNMLAEDFSCFNDSVSFEKKKDVRILKRAQIFVADLWAAFEGQSFGEFHDIDKITIFADYRIPQLLQNLGCLWYSPTLENAIKDKQTLEAGGSWEIQIRGCSIWCVELIRQEILKAHPETEVNAILIDFFLYDTAKEREKEGKEGLPHHRVRSIWY